MIEFRLGFDDVESFQILGKPADFNMAAFTDDHGMVTLRNEARDGAVGEGDERAGALEDFEAMFAGIGDGALGSAVGGDHGNGCLDTGWIGFEADSLATEVVEDGLIVDEFAEDGQRLLAGFGLSESDGIADAETHTEMSCFEDIHLELRIKVE